MVRRVSFSSDSRWLAVASDRGTTHVYALGDALLGRSIGASHQHGSPFEAVAAVGLGAAIDADDGGDSIALTAGAAFDPTVVHATDISQVGIVATAATAPTVAASHRIWQTDVPSDVSEACIF